jgi:hypothetical protein
MQKSVLMLLIGMTGAFSAPAMAQINKCVDASGKTFYSQVPCPPNAKSSTIRSAAPPANPAPASASGAAPAAGAAKAAGPKSAAELELEFRKRRTEQADAEKKEQEKVAEAAQREENCRSSRGALAGIESGGRQSRVNEKGERFMLDDAQLAQERERARKAVDQWCK